MKRVGLFVIALVAAATMACGGADNAGSSPTGPSQTPSSTPSQPAPSPSGGLSAPTNLKLAAQNGSQISLSWTGTGAPEYLVLVGTSPSSSNTLSTNTTKTEYTWTVSPGTYYARVQSKNGTATSSSSNEVSFTVTQ